MDSCSWDLFIKTRNIFRKTIKDLEKSYPKIPTVYNNALEDITQDSNIKLILVGDNPGKKEAELGRYLVGPSGKLTDRFFKENPELGIDFYKNVIILNKTPIHTNRTNELKQLCKTKEIKTALEESQKKMAAVLLEFHKLLKVSVFITGYSEMRKNGIFQVYTDELKRLYAKYPDLYNRLFIFRHFSMNQFTIDLKNKRNKNEKTEEALKRIGADYRHRILEQL